MPTGKKFTHLNSPSLTYCDLSTTYAMKSQNKDGNIKYSI